MILYFLIFYEIPQRSFSLNIFGVCDEVLPQTKEDNPFLRLAAFLIMKKNSEFLQAK